MEELRKKFGMELLPSLRRKLKQIAVESDRPLYEVHEAAIRKFLEPDGKPTDPDPDIEMLCELKRIAQPDYAVLKQTLVVFLRDARRELVARQRKKA
jgi:hypothetical protein